MHPRSFQCPPSVGCCASESERSAGLPVTGRSRERVFRPPAWRIRYGKRSENQAQSSRDIPFNKLVLSSPTSAA